MGYPLNISNYSAKRNFLNFAMFALFENLRKVFGNSLYLCGTDTQREKNQII